MSDERYPSRAMTIARFCERYSVGRTTVYEEIKAGRLRALKVGRKTLISEEHAEAWLNVLPEMGSAK